jgi:hypothetical protein
MKSAVTPHLPKISILVIAFILLGLLLSCRRDEEEIQSLIIFARDVSASANDDKAFKSAVDSACRASIENARGSGSNFTLIKYADYAETNNQFSKIGDSKKSSNKLSKKECGDLAFAASEKQTSPFEALKEIRTAMERELPKDRSSGKENIKPLVIFSLQALDDDANGSPDLNKLILQLSEFAKEMETRQGKIIIIPGYHENLRARLNKAELPKSVTFCNYKKSIENEQNLDAKHQCSEIVSRSIKSIMNSAKTNQDMDS